MRAAKLLFFLGVSCASLICPTQSFALNLWVVRGFNNSEEPFRIIGRGYVEVGDADVDVAAWVELRRFCDDNYEANEALCQDVPDSITANHSIGDARFTMYGHTFYADDFQWSYNYDLYTETQVSIFIQMGEWGVDPFLFYASDGEDFGFAYVVNGHAPIGSPYCDNHLCEFLYWSEEGLPPWAVPEPNTLALFVLSLGALCLISRQRRKAA